MTLFLFSDPDARSRNPEAPPPRGVAFHLGPAAARHYKTTHPRAHPQCGWIIAHIR